VEEFLKTPGCKKLRLLKVLIRCIRRTGSVVPGELFFGCKRSSRRQFNEKKLRQAVSRLKIEVIDSNTDVARKYAVIYLSLQKKGMKIPVNDVLISACCRAMGQLS